MKRFRGSGIGYCHGLGPYLPVRGPFIFFKLTRKTINYLTFSIENCVLLLGGAFVSKMVSFQVVIKKVCLIYHDYHNWRPNFYGIPFDVIYLEILRRTSSDTSVILSRIA